MSGNGKAAGKDLIPAAVYIDAARYSDFSQISFAGLDKSVVFRYAFKYGSLAQWLELPAHNRLVPGSSP